MFIKKHKKNQKDIKRKINVLMMPQPTKDKTHNVYYELYTSMALVGGLIYGNGLKRHSLFNQPKEEFKSLW